MKIPVRSAITLVLTLSQLGCSTPQGLPKGEVYEDISGEQRIVVQSDTDLDIIEWNKAYRGEYLIQADGRVAVAVDVLGTSQVRYFERLEEGLQEIEPDGKVVRTYLDQVHIDAVKQERTVGDIRMVGVAWYSWLQDQASATIAEPSMSDWKSLKADMSADQLLSTLFVSNTMFYIQNIPREDGWGNPYDFQWSGDLTASAAIGIRSPGKDGRFSSDSYKAKSFPPSDVAEDIVWISGEFVRYPDGAIP